MAIFEELAPSFLVLCSDDFATKLSIPTPVVNEHLNFLCKIIVELTTGPGRFWNVELEEIDDGFYFTEGWSDFVKDNSLIVEGKHLLFRIAGDSTLHVSIFGHHSWLERPSYEGVATTPWRFVKKLKMHDFTAYKLDIPKQFAEGTGIATSRKIVLEDEYGREWPITLLNHQRYIMTSGLMNYLRANKLRVGSILLFEFVPNSNNVVKVVTMEKEAGEEMLSQAKIGGLL